MVLCIHLMMLKELWNWVKGGLGEIGSSAQIVKKGLQNQASLLGTLRAKKKATKCLRKL